MVSCPCPLNLCSLTTWIKILGGLRKEGTSKDKTDCYVLFDGF